MPNVGSHRVTLLAVPSYQIDAHGRKRHRDEDNQHPGKGAGRAAGKGAGNGKGNGGKGGKGGKGRGGRFGRRPQ